MVWSSENIRDFVFPLSGSQKFKAQQRLLVLRILLLQNINISLQTTFMESIRLQVTSITKFSISHLLSTTQILDGRRPECNNEWLIVNTLLFYQDNLDPNITHSFTIPNGVGVFVFNYVQFWKLKFQKYMGLGPSSPSDSLPVAHQSQHPQHL